MISPKQITPIKSFFQNDKLLFCTICNKHLPEKLFYSPHKLTRSGYCKECVLKNKAIKRRAKGIPLKRVLKKYTDKFYCYDCKEYLPLAQFTEGSIKARKKDKRLGTRCKNC